MNEYKLNNVKEKKNINNNSNFDKSNKDKFNTKKIEILKTLT